MVKSAAVDDGDEWWKPTYYGETYCLHRLYQLNAVACDSIRTLRSQFRWSKVTLVESNWNEIINEIQI